MPCMRIGPTEILDTYAEAFGTRYTRLMITAADDHWLDAALRALAGYGTSVLGCDAEAGMERHLAMRAAVLEREHRAGLGARQHDRIAGEGDADRLAAREISGARQRIPAVRIDARLAQVGLVGRAGMRGKLAGMRQRHRGPPLSVREGGTILRRRDTIGPLATDHA